MDCNKIASFSIYFSLRRRLPSRRNAKSNEGPVFGHLDGRRWVTDAHISSQHNRTTRQLGLQRTERRLRDDE